MATLLQINKLHKSYASHIILDDANLNISEKQKIAVIGRNGAGKSTLFKIIVGDENQDSGEVIQGPNTRLGYLTQHNPYEDNELVIDFLTRSSGKEEWECGKIAGQFQIKDELYVEIGSLAGGYQMRVKLISMLLKEPNLLLLDEPTNYLDLSTQILLEEFLKSYNGAFLLISHDREFLKNTCQQTLEIERGKTFLYPRTIDEYLIYKEEQVEQKERHNKKIEREKKHLQQFVDKFRAKASKASQAQSKMKQIEKLKTIDISHPLKTTQINIPKIEDRKGIALKIDDLNIGYPEKTIATKITLDIDRGENIAIVGDNGQGKTTFLKTIAGELDKISGDFKWGSNIKTGYYAQHIPATMRSEESVKAYLERISPADVMKEEIFKMAGNFLFNREALKKKISVLSGGEKARLCLAGLLLAKNQVLLLDEPTNHLDFETVEALALALRESNTTLLFVSHNRTFVEIIASGIIEVGNGKVCRYHHNYEEYVYHLKHKIEKELDPKNQNTQENKSDPKDEKKDKKQNRYKLKEQKKKLRKTEKEIEKLEKQKHELVKWFEENYTEYSKEKTEELNKIEKELKEKEEKWMKIEMYIDGEEML